MQRISRYPLVDTRVRDACGVGFVARMGADPSRDIVDRGMEALANLTHRGAVSADGKTGDGAGVMTEIPRAFFAREVRRLGARVSDPADLAVAMVFLPRDDPRASRQCRRFLEQAVRDHGMRVVGWRQVPVDETALGDTARSTVPDVGQLVAARGARLDPDDFDQAVYLARRQAENRASEALTSSFYVASFSTRTLVYKGLFVAPQLARFYRDLEDPAFESRFVLFHQRYSTNTFPTWALAQPFRYLAHNGEINALNGNLNWMQAREREMAAPVWEGRLEEIRPVVQEGVSDSAALDNVVDLLRSSGRDLPHALMMLVPEAWENRRDLPAERRAFYEFHGCLCEPWDGPAALAFSDGHVVGAALDRNGLRPARYAMADDGLIVLSSEAGVVDLDDARVVHRGKLGPGEILAVDLDAGRLLEDDDVKNDVCRRRNYAAWLEQASVPVPGPTGDAGAPAEADDLLRRQIAFAYTSDEIQTILKPMAASAKEPVGSMGDDTPLAVLSARPRPVYDYLKQRFAQVTNPPIDPIRERLVMSLSTNLGRGHSLLEESRDHARVLILPSPVLDAGQLDAVESADPVDFSSARIPLTFRADEGPAALEPALRRVCDRALEEVRQGTAVLVLSDEDVDERHAAIPMLLGLGAVHQHLIQQGVRLRASLVAVTGDARDVHHVACLLGCGADAVHPYLALETARALSRAGSLGETGERDAALHTLAALDNGLLKVMSKMGISTVNSYRGSQLFEAIGLDSQVTRFCFPAVPSRLGGVGFDDLGENILLLHTLAYQPEGDRMLAAGGDYRFRRDGEYHGYNPGLVTSLQKAVRTGEFEDYRVYAETAHDHAPASLRDLLTLRGDRDAVPIDEVEPVESIMRRFSTAAMSLGALSPEAHEAIAVAMNRIGGRSNSGEGGEDAARFSRRPDGDWADSAIKQVASGRFGVTTEYLSAARELQIKMAQGSKPGEGGQLPGDKVNDTIACLRHSTPGVTLISPPPHHDIYSIEDLAQLIYDLKQVNPRAKVSVKLVSEAGVGTIAAGVAKAYADVITVSGHEGGTGASPVSSIKNAGSPWELGLAETQQTLVLNNLRGRVQIETDGGIRTGLDVVKAALLGADRFGFGTSVLIAVGCKMVRQCHLNTCPVGVATQDAKRRQKFIGKPEMVVHFFRFMAEHVRQILASLGYRALGEVIGRTDLLEPRADIEGRAAKLNLGALLAQADPDHTNPWSCAQPRNDRPDDDPLDDTILADLEGAAGDDGFRQLRYPVRNVQRSVGARVAGASVHAARRTGPAAQPLVVELRGSAGQSFGAFNVDGIDLVLYGEANDYVGKGMSGGTIVCRPPEGSRYAWEENVILGNTVLYGATGGRLFAAGRAGERFGVRNSGAVAVVEGVGDHGCEYMTSGTVVVLGATGRNFAAGMTGGTAYVYDPRGTFEARCNTELVIVAGLDEQDEREALRTLIAQHADRTGSPLARRCLAEWDRACAGFRRVIPRSAAGERPAVQQKEAATRAP